MSNTEIISAEVPSTTTPTDTTPPLPPILIFPSNHLYLNDPHLRFTWKQTHDPNSNSLNYTLYLNQQPFPNLPANANLIKTQFHTLAQPDTFNFFLKSPLHDGSYTWYVIALDSNQNQSRSATFQFTLDTQPPQLILNSLDKHQNLHLTTSNDPISFKFDPSTTTHQLTLTTEANSLVILHIVNLTSLKTQSLTQTCPSHQNPCQLQFNFQLYNAPYELQLKALDLAHNQTLLPSIKLNPSITQTSPNYLPATLAQIKSTRPNLAIIFFVLLAIIISVLIKHKKKHWNLFLIITTSHPSNKITISHLPPNSTKLKTYRFQISKPIFIPHLQSHSTLIFHFSNQSPSLSLCLLSSSPRYKIHI